MNESTANSSSTLYDENSTGMLTRYTYYLGILRILVWFGLGMPTVFINSLILRGLVLGKELPRPCRTLLVNLGCCDFLCGVTMMGNSVLLLHPDNVSSDLCATGMGMFAILAVVSVILSTLFPINAYLSTVITFKYRGTMRPVKLSVISFTVWAVSIALVAASLVDRHTENQTCGMLFVFPSATLRGFGGLYVICSVVMTSFFWKLYTVAKSQISKIVSDTHRDHKDTINLSLQNKALKTVSAIAASFWLTYTPLAVFLLIMSFETAEKFRRIESIVFELIFTTVFLSKSLVNPVVYAWKIPFVREVTHSLFRKIRKVRQDPNTSLTLDRTTAGTTVV